MEWGELGVFRELGGLTLKALETYRRVLGEQETNFSLQDKEVKQQVASLTR